MKETIRPRSRQHLICLAALAVGYLSLFLSYRPYELDNAWFLSFSYGFIHGVPKDEFMSIRFPAGQDGTILFGKIAASVQAAVGEVFGWQQFHFLELNCVLLVLALAATVYVLRRSGCSQRFTILFLLAFGISEPVVSAVERFRYEALGFCLCSLGLALVAAEVSFCGIVLSLIAMETQPIAVLGVIPVLCLAWSRRRESSLRFGFRVLLAALLAGTVYFLLHPQSFEFLSAVRKLQQMQRTESNPGILIYFLKGRHYWEAALFLLIPSSLAIRWARERALNIPFGTQWIFICAGLSLVVGCLIKHTNPAYMLYLYPYLLAALMLLFRDRRWQAGVALTFSAIFVVEYMQLVRLDWGQGYRARDIARVQKDIGDAAQIMGKSPSDIVITGDYSLWFAHPDHFHANARSNEAFWPASDLLLCYDNKLPGVSAPDLLHCSDYQQQYPRITLLKTDLIRGNKLSIFRAHPVGPSGH